jgi:Flp pilus assembly pilin Flp
MRSIVRRLWCDDSGAMLATEWVFMATILVIGVIPGIVAVRNSLNAALLKSACQLNSSSCACSSAIVPLPADNNVPIDQSPCD